MPTLSEDDKTIIAANELFERLDEAIKLAKEIASKSPVAVSATKMSLVYSRDHSVQEGLDHIATLNSAMLQTDDLGIAATSMM